MESPYLISGYGLTCEVYVLELDRGQHSESAVPTLPVVEDLKVLEHGVGQPSGVAITPDGVRSFFSISSDSTARFAFCPRKIR